MQKKDFTIHFQSNIEGSVAEMQRMLSGIPEVGKVYTPKGHPEVQFKVKEVDVSLTQGEDGVERSFFITCCDPTDPTEKKAFDFIADEWVRIGFELVFSEAENSLEEEASALVKAPKVGNTYVSLVYPKLVLRVEHVDVIEADADNKAGFMATCYSSDSKDNTSILCYEFVEDEWLAHLFVPFHGSKAG